MHYSKNKIIIALGFVNIITFIIGFYLNENSAGAGGYSGDLSHVWKNLNLVLKSDFLETIENQNYFSNRTPLLYFIHKYLNPLTSNIDNFRLSVFILSFFGLYFFYECLKLNQNNNKYELFLLSTLLLLSPYYRTSSYWALEENFGIISVLLSILFFLKNEKKPSLVNSILSIFFSSLCVYFDQKLLIIPLLFFISKIFLKNTTNQKKTFVVFYFIFSIPYVYLIYKWKSIFPISHVNLHSLTNNFLWNNILYALTIIAFYFFPFLIQEKNIFYQLKKFFSNKFFLLVLFIFFCLVVYLKFFFILPQFEYHSYFEGGGLIRKLLNMINITDDNKNIILVFISFFSLIIIVFFCKNIESFLIIIFFTIISIFLYPLFQESYDPILLILILLIVKKNTFFSKNNLYFINFYFLIFLIGAIAYYN